MRILTPQYVNSEGILTSEETRRFHVPFAEFVNLSVPLGLTCRRTFPSQQHRRHRITQNSALGNLAIGAQANGQTNIVGYWQYQQSGCHCRTPAGFKEVLIDGDAYQYFIRARTTIDQTVAPMTQGFAIRTISRENNNSLGMSRCMIAS